MGRINTILQDMESLAYFRSAVYTSYQSYTAYKYIESSKAWYLFTELSPEILITYTLQKGTDEEATFLDDKSSCDAFTPRKRMDANIKDFDLAVTEAEHYAQMGYHINMLAKALDGYHPDITGTEHYHQHAEVLKHLLYAADGYGQGLTELEHYKQHSDAIQTILKDLDGYASDQTVSEHYHQHSEAITTIIGELDGYTNSNFGTEYWYVERNELYQTTSNNWREVLSLETTSIPAGDYHIGWNAELGCNNGNKIPYMQVEVDDTTVVAEHTMRFAHNEGFSAHGGIVKVTLGAGTHTVDIDVNASDSGSYATKIKRARIEMWRVS